MFSSTTQFLHVVRVPLVSLTGQFRISSRRKTWVSMFKSDSQETMLVAPMWLVCLASHGRVPISLGNAPAIIGISLKPGLASLGRAQTTLEKD